MLIAFTKHARCFSNLFLSSYWKFVPFDDHFLVSIPPPPPQIYTSCYLSFRLTFSGSPGDVTQYLSVCTWLIPLSTPPTFPQATTNDRMSFCLPGCLEHTFTIHLSPVRYVCFFSYLSWYEHRWDEPRDAAIPSAYPFQFLVPYNPTPGF